MTTFTMRYIKGHFVVTGLDVPPMQFKSRAEARDWCKAHYPRSPVTEIGRDASSRIVGGLKGGRAGQPQIRRGRLASWATQDL